MKIIWAAPKDSRDYMNSLSDLVSGSSKNDLVVYYTAKSGEMPLGLSEESRRDAFFAASSLAGRGRGALVSKPTGPASDMKRSIEYMIQVA